MVGNVPVSGAQAPAMDPLQPLIAAARALAILVVSLLLAGTLITIFGSGSVLTIGDDPICSTVSAGREVPLAGGDDSARIAFWRLAPRVHPIDDVYRLCQDKPGGTSQVLSVLTVLPQLALLLGFLAVVLLLGRRTRRSGLFSRPVVQTVHWLGWYLLAGALLTSTVQAVATSGLVRQMVPGHGVFDFTGYWQVSIPTLLAGAGILTIARVLRLTVVMREDLDATI